MTDELISKTDVVKIVKSVLSPASSLTNVARARRQMLNEINELESKPEPHGRLIAEKTITEIRYHDADGYHIVNGEQLCELEIDAETVIEAEGRDDTE